MTTLIIASLASANPMGAEVYQDEVSTRASEALAHVDGARWAVRRLAVTSMRSPLHADRRLPMGRLARASAAARATVGAAVYPRHGVLHRMNLELPPGRAGNVVTLHDVVAWRFPDESPPVAAAREELARADAVIAVSEFTAQEAADLLGLHRVHVVPNGVDERFRTAQPVEDRVLADLGIPGPYVLTAGGASARKNLALLAQAWPIVAAARQGVSLVLVGPEHPRRTELFSGMPRVILTGRVPAEHVPGLMARAAAVVVPSSYEGFGLPALEGMAAGSPVVAARTSALPEVVGDGGLLVDARPEALVEGIIDAIDAGPDVRAMVDRGRARAAEFTWARSAEGHARVWAAADPGRPGAPTAGRRG